MKSQNIDFLQEMTRLILCDVVLDYEYDHVFLVRQKQYTRNITLLEKFSLEWVNLNTGETYCKEPFEKDLE